MKTAVKAVTPPINAALAMHNFQQALTSRALSLASACICPALLLQLYFCKYRSDQHRNGGFSAEN